MILCLLRLSDCARFRGCTMIGALSLPKPYAALSFPSFLFLGYLRSHDLAPPPNAAVSFEHF